ncbi:NAD-dependent epimerase/dehydratase family protein [Thermodesulfobacteriota bacterium]
MKKRWIITGANGYLGGQLCKKLHDLGEGILGVTREGRSLKHLEDMNISCHRYAELPSILSNCDVFVHCAGKVGNRGTWDEFVKINRDWTLSLFKQAQEYGVSCFIYVSSVAALGYMTRPGRTNLDELSLPMHVKGEFYGRSKLLAEKALMGRVASGMTRLIILRPGLIYGRRPFVSSRSWFRRPVVVDSDQRVPLVHIDNFIAAVSEVAEHPEAQGVFHVVDEEQPTLSELNALKMQFGILRYSPWYIGKTGFWLLWFCRGINRILCGRIGENIKEYVLAEYYFHTRRLIYSTQKLRSQVGWTPSTHLESNLKEASTNPTATEKI